MNEDNQPLTDDKDQTIGFKDWLIGIAMLIVLAGLLGLAIYTVIHYDWSIYKNGRWKLLGDFFKQVGLMIAFSSAVIALTWLILLLETLTGRWRQIGIFLSYQHDHEDLAKSVKKTLETKWTKTFFIPYKVEEHDKIIESVQEFLKKSDIVIVLPAMQKSFVDAEILTASTLEKPILFLKINEGQTTPDTGYRGYPVFDLEKLQAYRFMPLHRFILYVSKSPKDILKNFARASSGFGKSMDTVFIIFFVIGAISSIVGPLVNVFFSAEWERKIIIYKFWIVALLAVVFFATRYIKVILNRLLAIRITRQEIRTGDLTYSKLEKGLNGLKKDKQILECILQFSLPARH